MPPDAFAIDGVCVGGLRVAAVCRFFQVSSSMLSSKIRSAPAASFVQLCQRVHFDFHAGQRSYRLLCLPYGLGNAAAIGNGGCLSDEDGVIQPMRWFTLHPL